MSKESLLLLGVLACPITMGLMMLMMGRKHSKDDKDNHHRNHN